MNDLLNTLEADRRSRKHGVTDDLYGLPIVEKNWDFSYPTLDRNNWRKNKPSEPTSDYLPYPANDAEYCQRFYAAYPFLRNYMTNMTNNNDKKGIFFAGGTISRLMKHPKPPQEIIAHNDLDIFFYGLTSDEAKQKMMEFDAYLRKNIDNNIQIIYALNQYILSIFIRNQPPIEIQFIFRLYKTKSEIIHGFDFGSCAIGFDGRKVYFTSLSKFAFEYGYNILDTTRRSTSYEFRLAKYANRGFGLILPRLDIDIIRRDLNNKELEDNIRAGGVLRRHPRNYRWDNQNNIDKNTVIFYLPYLLIFIKRDASSTTHKNHINHLNHIIGGFSPRFTNNYHPRQHDYENPLNQPNNLNNPYYGDDIRTDEWRNGKNIKNLTNGESGKIRLWGEDLNNLLNDYQTSLIDINNDINRYFTRLVEYGLEFKISGVKSIDKTLNSHIFVTVRNEILAQQGRVLELAKNFIEQRRNIQFIEQNPGTQLTSSINPIIEDEMVWYGIDHYKYPLESDPLTKITEIKYYDTTASDKTTANSDYSEEMQSEWIIINNQNYLTANGCIYKLPEAIYNLLTEGKLETVPESDLVLVGRIINGKPFLDSKYVDKPNKTDPIDMTDDMTKTPKSSKALKSAKTAKAAKTAKVVESSDNSDNSEDSS